MKDFSTVYYIFSVFAKGVSEEANALEHDGILRYLKKTGVSATEGVGTYMGFPEKSILVNGINSDEDSIAAICKDFNQECFLKVYTDNAAELIKQDGSREFIGKFLQEEESNLKPHQDYSKFNDKIFVIQ